MKHTILYIFVFLFHQSFISFAQINIFNTTPEWVSNALGHYATGLGVADINQDGWNDIIVANGNDMNRQSLVVYYNNGDGTFPQSPSWSSNDIDYNGHLSVGDIDGDNLPDVAVSRFLGAAGFSEPGKVKIYFNTGTELESTPSWQSADNMYNFSCALGDADGDGDLDLAVACGEPYSSHFAYGKIYYNDNGSMQTLSGWQSQVLMGALDVDFIDFDNNGFLDVAFACHLTPNYIFLADSSGTISTQPSWSSSDNNYYANSLTVAKLDTNEYRDLVISDNNQLGGHGKYKAYLFDSAPYGQSSPDWFSTSGGYGSAVLAEDIDFDGQVDLLAGKWWGKVEFYSGADNGFVTNPTWTSTTNSVIEAFVLRDVDKDGRITKTDTIHITNDSAHVFYLSVMSVEEINSVLLNDQPIQPGSDYCTLPGAQWLSAKSTLINGDIIIVNYLYSKDRDLIVSNWDPSVGNYLFYNNGSITSISPATAKPSSPDIQMSPNPFNQSCRITINLPKKDNLTIRIYDINGRLVKTIYDGITPAGVNDYFWYGDNKNGNYLSSGSYFYTLITSNDIKVGKLILLR